MAPDKTDIHIIFFLSLHENICYWYLLEAPRRGTQHRFRGENISVRFG